MSDFGFQYQDSYDSDPFNNALISNSSDVVANFEDLAESIKSDIRALRQSINSVQKALGHLGSSNDSPTLRSKIKFLRYEIGRLDSAIETNLKDLNQIPNPQHHQKLQIDHYNQEYSDLCSMSSSTLTQIDSQIQNRPLSQQYEPVYENGYQDQNIDPEQIVYQNQIQSKIDQNNYIIADRTQDIHTIVTDINDVNQITGQLASLVDSQTPMYETLQTTSEDTSSYTHGAMEQTLKAQRSQKAFRRKICYTLFCALIMAAIVAIMVLTMFNKKK